MRAIRALLAGALSFGAFYVAYGWLMHEAVGSWPWTVAYLASLPFAGMWWVRYRRQLARYSERIVVRTIFLSNRKILRQLTLQREEILMLLEELRLQWQVRQRRLEAEARAESVA